MERRARPDVFATDVPDSHNASFTYELIRSFYQEAPRELCDASFQVCADLLQKSTDGFAGFASRKFLVERDHRDL